MVVYHTSRHTGLFNSQNKAPSSVWGLAPAWPTEASPGFFIQWWNVHNLHYKILSSGGKARQNTDSNVVGWLRFINEAKLISPKSEKRRRSLRGETGRSLSAAPTRIPDPGKSCKRLGIGWSMAWTCPFPLLATPGVSWLCSHHWLHTCGN